MNTESEDLLKRYVEAVIIPRMTTDNVKYPIRDSRINHMFLKEYTQEFMDDLNELKSRGYSHRDIGLLFRNPTRLMRMTHLLLKGAELGGCMKEQRQELALEILRIIQSIKHGSIFNEDKRNIVLSPGEVSGLIEGNGFADADAEHAMRVQRLCGVLWAYSETPYFVAHDIGMEEHGLYEHEGGKVMVRDYMNLRPTELWAECTGFPYNEMQVICVYDRNLMVDFDVFYNIHAVKGSFTKDLREYRVTADGRPLKSSEFDEILDASTKIITSISQKIESLSEREIARKYAEIYWYRKRPLRDALETDWKPPEKVYENIENGEIKPDMTRSLTPDDIRADMGLV